MKLNETEAELWKAMSATADDADDIDSSESPTDTLGAVPLPELP